MVIVYPKYLGEEAYQNRHLKIHILLNTAKAGSVVQAADYLINQGKELAAFVGDQAKKATIGKTDLDIKKINNSFNKSTQELDKILKKNVEIIHTLVLPLPSTFTDSHSHEYSADKGVVGSLSEAFFDGSVVSKGLAIAYDQLGARKPLADPGYFQNYSGTAPREFQLSFDLVPENTEDAGNIYLLINTLRKYSLPSTAVNHALILAPHFFELELTNPLINQMLNANEVVLTNMSIDYGADGEMQQTPDGMPKHIKLDLSFAERKMQTSNLYDDGAL